MAGEQASRRCRERVLRIVRSRALSDDESLRLEIVDELRRGIGFDAWGWPLSDPDSLLPTTGIADSAMWPVVPRIVIHEERVGDLNTDRELATRGDPVATLAHATRGDLLRSRRYRDVLGPHGFGDELRAACVDRYGCWGHLRLYRDASGAHFTSENAELLRTVIGAIASALRERAARPATGASVERLEPAIVVLDRELAVRSYTSTAGAWFEALAGKGAPKGPNARCAVLSAAARCIADSASPSRARLRLRDGRWIVAEAARLEGHDAGVVVTVHPATIKEVLDLLARAYGLTSRERQLVALVVEGHDTLELARLLAISRHTVQQHLKSVFDKVGVRSRRELVTGVFAKPS